MELTEHYIGKKILKATPLTRGDYNNYRDWITPEDENPGDEGYLVEYLDGGKSNHPDHKGYISWSPKDVFEVAYIPMGHIPTGLMGHIVRLQGEIAENADRIQKLKTFLEDHLVPLSDEQRELLEAQLDSMLRLDDILEKRLSLEMETHHPDVQLA